MSEQITKSDPYTIRLCEPADMDDFLSLYETVFGDDGSSEWFQWKYIDNPYVSHIPMFVAEHDGKIVGTRPYLAFEMYVDGKRLLSIQTGDTMVHPDHRRKGLFTRMTERSFDYYGGFDDPVLKFSVPNALSRPGYLKLGCKEVGPLTTYYRVQSPQSMAGSGATGLVAKAATPIARRYYDYKLDSTRGKADNSITVTEHNTIPVDAFVRLYQKGSPAEIHAVRDHRFYRWRYGNPQWEYTAYTATESGETIAGIVIGRQERPDGAVVQLTEVVPHRGGDRRTAGLSTLLGHILDVHRDAALVSVCGSSIPDSVLSAYGFLSDQSLPLSIVATPTVLITRLLNGEESPPWTVGTADLREMDGWNLSFSEQNTS